MTDPNELHPLLLAYLGDSVFEEKVREALIGVCPDPGECSRRALAYVTASAQSEAAKRLLPRLTEEEKDLFTRAKNAKSHTVPRNVPPYTYRLATALEALFGMWRLTGGEERIREALALAFPDLFKPEGEET